MFPTGWLQKHKITLDVTSLSLSGSLSDYPFLLTQDSFLPAIFSDSQGKELATNLLLNDANLKAYYKMENVNDETANAFHLTNNGTTTFAAAKFSNGMQQGTSNSSKYLSINNDLGITTGAMSVSMWVKINTAPGLNATYGLFQHGDAGAHIRHMIRYQDVAGVKRLVFNRLKENVANELFTYNIDLGTTSFFLLTYTYDGTTVKGFVNGMQVGSVAASGSGSTGVDIDYTYIGAERTQTPSVDNYSSALIDDVAIFNDALTAQEVLTIFTGGADIRFSSDEAGTTQLASEIVNWDIVNSQAEVWVKIPTLTNTTTDIWVWYDKADEAPLARTDTYGSDNVWPSAYKGVWHFEDSYRDSSANIHDLTSHNNPVLATGKISKALDLESGSNNYLSKADNADFDIGTGSMSVQMWVKRESAGIFGGFFSKVDNADGQGYRFTTENDNKLGYFFSNGVSADNATTTNAFASTADWYFLIFQRNGTNVKIYVNNVEELSATDNLRNTDNAQPIAIGPYRSGALTSNNFDGLIDEARFIKASVLTADWRKADYNIQGDPATYSEPISPTGDTFKPKIIYLV